LVRLGCRNEKLLKMRVSLGLGIKKIER
jgi:hypothetical protein